MKNSTKTLIFTLVLSLVVIVVAFFVQLKAQIELTNCSYLDPITVDILAFSAGLFLVIEGICRLLEHKSATLKRQFTRSIRIALGLAILTLHVMQFIHK